MPDAPTFPEAKYYACNDPETLTHESPEEAVEAYLDDLASPGSSAAADIHAHGPITVTGYVPEEATDAWKMREADRLLEQLEEDWFENYGDPDGDHGPDFPTGAEDLMRAVIKVLLAASTPWQCKSVGKVVLSPEQVEEMMRAYNPEWFEPPDRDLSPTVRSVIEAGVKALGKP